MNKQEFETYLENGFKYQGLMNGMANSIELLLDCIFEKLNIKPPTMLGQKISKFQKNKTHLMVQYSGDFDKLVETLRKFNENWIITKHGMIVGGLQDLTFRKDGKFYKFDQKTQAEISSCFTQTMQNLTEIHNKL